MPAVAAVLRLVPAISPLLFAQCLDVRLRIGKIVKNAAYPSLFVARHRKDITTVRTYGLQISIFQKDHYNHYMYKALANGKLIQSG